MKGAQVLLNGMGLGSCLRGLQEWHMGAALAQWNGPWCMSQSETGMGHGHSFSLEDAWEFLDNCARGTGFAEWNGPWLMSQGLTGMGHGRSFCSMEWALVYVSEFDRNGTWAQGFLGRCLGIHSQL